ncbi:MAG: YciI family protein [Pseudomonadota bacterium]
MFKKTLFMGLALLLTSQLSLADGHKGPDGEESELAKLVKTFANFELWVIETNPAKPELFRDNIMPHLQYQLELEAKGVMFAAGPLIAKKDTPPPLNSGLIVIRAKDKAEAQSIADADPMHSSGARTYTLRKWIVNEGSINVSIKLSGQNRSTID